MTLQFFFISSRLTSARIIQELIQPWLNCPQIPFKYFIYSTNKYFSHCKGILVTGGFTSTVAGLYDVATTTECYDVITNPDGSQELKWSILTNLSPPDAHVSIISSSSTV